MSQAGRVRKLEEEIRRLCQRLLAAQGADFESALRKLNIVLELWDQPRNEIETAQLSGPLVLVADDEPSIVRTVCAILEVYGFHTVGAGSGKEAIAKAADICPDVLLCDVMMPGMNGFETALEVKNLCPKCRLLFFTAYSNTSELAVDLTNAGHLFEVLSKPLPAAMLVDRIKAAMAST